MKGERSAAQLNAAKFGPGRIKHLETREMFVKEVVRLKLVRLQKVRTDEHVRMSSRGGGGRIS